VQIATSPEACRAWAVQQRHCAEFVIDAALKHQSLLGCQVQSLDVRVTQLPIQ
jgi:hypothetical protein